MFWQYPFKKRRAEAELSSFNIVSEDIPRGSSCQIASHFIDLTPSTPTHSGNTASTVWHSRELNDDADDCTSNFQRKSKEELIHIARDLDHKLQLANAERAALKSTLNVAAAQFENLQRVLHELTHSRAKTTMERAELASRYGDLQQEYARALRVANLSRVVSQESTAAVAGARKELAEKEGQLRLAHIETVSLARKALRAQSNADQLRGRLSTLETRMDVSQKGFLESACLREIQRHSLAETY